MENLGGIVNFGILPGVSGRFCLEYPLGVRMFSKLAAPQANISQTSQTKTTTAETSDFSGSPQDTEHLFTRGLVNLLNVSDE